MTLENLLWGIGVVTSGGFIAALRAAYEAHRARVEMEKRLTIIENDLKWLKDMQGRKLVNI